MDGHLCNEYSKDSGARTSPVEGKVENTIDRVICNETVDLTPRDPGSDTVSQLQCQLNQSNQKILDQAAHLVAAKAKILKQKTLLIDAAKYMIEQEKILVSAGEKIRISNEIKTKLLETAICKLENEQQLRKGAEMKLEKLKASFKIVHFGISNTIEGLRNMDGAEEDTNPESLDSGQDLLLPSWINLRLQNLFQSRKELYQDSKESNMKLKKLTEFMERISALQNPNLTDTSKTSIRKISTSERHLTISYPKIARTEPQRQINAYSELSIQPMRASLRIDSKCVGDGGDQLAFSSGTITTDVTTISGCAESRTEDPQLRDCPLTKHPSGERSSESHEIDPTGTKGLRCTCGHKAVHRESLRSHINRYNTLPKFMCEKCNMNFVYSSQLKIHYKSVHKIAMAFSLGCRLCGQCFQTRLDLMAHHRKFHTGSASLHQEDKYKSLKGITKTCDARKQRVISKQKVEVLKRHARDRSDPSNRYRCTCGRNFNSSAAMFGHIRLRTNPYIFKCPFCPITFNMHSNLKKHVSRTHKRKYGNMQYGCSTCAQTFQTMAHLRIHRKRNHPTRKPKQSVENVNEDKSTDSSDPKNMHLPSRIPKFKLISSSSGNNLEHGAMSLDTNSLQCICGKVFGKQVLLQKHIYTETTEPKFTCSKCSKKFVFGSWLRAHYLSKHKIVWKFTVGCSICGKTFADNCKLMAHKRAKH